MSGKRLVSFYACLERGWYAFIPVWKEVGMLLKQREQKALKITLTVNANGLRKAD